MSFTTPPHSPIPSSSMSAQVQLSPDHEKQARKREFRKDMDAKLESSSITLAEAFSTYSLIDLPFMNREDEVLEALEALVRNQYAIWAQLPRDKRYVCFLDQMFGSGKTTFAQQFLARARLSYVLFLRHCQSELLTEERYMSWTNEQYDASNLHKDEYRSFVELGKRIFDFYQNWVAEQLVIDAGLSVEKSQKKQKEADEAKKQIFENILFETEIIYCAGFSQFCVSGSSRDDAVLRFEVLFPKDANESQVGKLSIQTRDVPNMLEKRMNKLQCKSLLFIMDETTGVPEERVRTVWQILNDISNSVMDNTARPRVGFQFSFMFVGRSTMFLKIGQGTTNSPTVVKWICLRMLQRYHVETLLHVLMLRGYNNLRSFEFLGQEQEEEQVQEQQDASHVKLFQQFVDKLHDATGGHPRLLQYTLSAISHIAPIIKDAVKSESDIDVLFDDLLFEGISENIPDREKYRLPCTDEEEQSFLDTALAALLFSGQFSTLLNVNSKIRIPNRGRTMQIGELLDRLPLFIDKCDKDQVKVKGSQYLYRILSMNASDSFSYGAYLAGLISQCQNGAAHFTSVDSVFEYLFAVATQRRAVFNRDLNATRFTIPGIFEEEDNTNSKQKQKQKRDILFPMACPILSTRTPIESIMIPKILDKIREEEKKCVPFDTLQRVHQFSLQATGTLDELAAAFTVLFKSDGLWVLIPRGQSHSCDLYVVFRQANSSVSVLIGFQIRSGNSDEGWKSVREELSKFWKSVPQTCKIDNSQNAAMTPIFVMAPRELKKGVKRAMGKQHVLIIPGGYDCWQQGDYLVMVNISVASQQNLSRMVECGYVFQEGMMKEKRLTTAIGKATRNYRDLNLSLDSDINNSGIKLPVLRFDGNTSEDFFNAKKWNHVLSVPRGCHTVIWSKKALKIYLGESAVKQFSDLKDMSNCKVETMVDILNGMNTVIGGSVIGPTERERGRTNVRSQISDRDVELIAQMKSLLLVSAETGMDVQRAKDVNSQLIHHRAVQSAYEVRIPITAAHLHGHKENRPSKRARTEIEMDGGMDTSYDIGVPLAGSSSSSRAITTRPLDREELQFDCQSAENEDVVLSLRGKLFTIPISTLSNRKSRLFTSMMMPGGDFRPKFNNKGEIVISRNPKHFELILDYLQGYERSVLNKIKRMERDELEEILDDVEFYGIQLLIGTIEKQLSSRITK